MPGIGIDGSGSPSETASAIGVRETTSPAVENVHPSTGATGSGSAQIPAAPGLGNIGVSSDSIGFLHGSGAGNGPRICLR